MVLTLGYINVGIATEMRGPVYSLPAFSAGIVLTAMLPTSASDTTAMAEIDTYDTK